ncbi:MULTISPECIES: MBL fold metallo-hydrolase [unclassified Pseudomonas]|uniref:MBL fold metallo-hydrolase n=1 Tax=unclassified Pseudomonas TaxID=196821 RepID=UPI001EE12624|nr:MBL fold metallo-hydrolase [Pseudomonas sp. MMS21 TM103]MCG4455367.1 MBL fold metallo-hydrolase [Pseudomonas sp. MMS21 TM103]
MQAHIEAFFDPATFTYSYVVSDPATRRCAIVDSVLDYDQAAGRTSFENADRLIAYVREQGLSVDWLLETHVHADHLSAAPYLQRELGGQLAIGELITVVQTTFGKLFNAGSEFATDGRQFDRLFSDGECFQIGSLAARVIHTPGHTPACLTYVVGDAAFVGDTLFMPDYGTARCDFPGGDARVMFRSIRKLFDLPDQTRLYMCHDYKAPGREEFLNESTLAEQRAHNVHVHEGVSEDEFVAMRRARDATLGMPALILPAVQVNMRAGQLPPPEDNGTRYLKIPLDVL